MRNARGIEPHASHDVAAAPEQSQLDLVPRDRAPALEPQRTQETGRGVVAFGVGLEEHELALAQHGEVPDASRVDEDVERKQRHRLGQHVGVRILDRRQGVDGGAKLGDTLACQRERRGRGGPRIRLEERSDPGREVTGRLAKLDLLEPERARRSDTRLGIRLREHRRRLQAPGGARRGGTRLLPVCGRPHGLGQPRELRRVTSLHRGQCPPLGAQPLLLGGLLGSTCRRSQRGDGAASRDVEVMLLGVVAGQPLEGRERLAQGVRRVGLGELGEAAREGVERDGMRAIHLLGRDQRILLGGECAPELGGRVASSSTCAQSCRPTAVRLCASRRFTVVRLSRALR